MRTVPTQVTDGFTNHYTAFWVVKVEPSTGDPYYWTTTSKNRTGNAFTLKWDSSTTVTPDSGMIAHRDWATGEEYSGIGEMESGVDINSGGSVATVSDLEIQVLNQESFHNTVIQANINIENRPISIWFGFIPDGASQTVIVSTEMLKRWSGVVEEVMDYNYQTFILRCVDGSFQRHKDIPTTVINTEDFPNAPKESVGRPIPICYGAFYVSETLERDLEEISPAPAIKTDEITQEFWVADHACHTFSKVYTFAQDNNLFGQLVDPDASTNSAAEASFDYNAGGDIIATFRQIPSMPSSKSDVSSNAPFDKSSASYATAGFGAGSIFGKLNRPKEIGKLVDESGTVDAIFKIRVYTKEIENWESGKLQIAYHDGSSANSLYLFLAADENTIKVGTTSAAPVQTWENMGDYHFGVYNDGATSMTIQIAHIVVEYYVLVYALAVTGVNLRTFNQTYRWNTMELLNGKR